MYSKKKNEKDVRYILDNLREIDKEEVKTVHGKNWKEIVYNDIMKTDFEVLCGITKNGDVPVCMGGVWHLNKDPVDTGVIWMLSTKGIKDYKHCFLRYLKRRMADYDNDFRFLYNFIYSKNYLAKKWLSGLGFKFDKSGFGGNDVPEGFEFFYRVRETKGII